MVDKTIADRLIMKPVRSMATFDGREWFADTKYDGCFVVVVKDGDKWVLVTRRGIVYRQFSEVLADVLADAIYTAELYGFKNGKPLAFQGGDSFLSAQKNGVLSNMKIAITDVLYLKGENVMLRPLRERRKLLEDVVVENGLVHLSEMRVVKTREEAEAWFRDRIEHGYEGLILKDSRSPYVPKTRSSDWVKMKDKDAFDCVVVALFKERKKPSMLLGMYDNGELKTVGKCALTDLNRAIINDVLPELKSGEDDKFIYLKPKIVVEVSAQEMVKSEKYTLGYALRFPRFVRFRIDKPAVECSL